MREADSKNDIRTCVLHTIVLIHIADSAVYWDYLLCWYLVRILAEDYFGDIGVHSIVSSDGYEYRAFSIQISLQ